MDGFYRQQQQNAPVAGGKGEEVNKMKKTHREISSILLIGFFICNIFLTSINFVVAQDEMQSEFEGELSCENEDIVTNSQWQWYKVIVDIGDNVIFNLEYSGDLDLDLKAYWKRDNFPEFEGYDLTHCPREDANGEEIYEVADYSQFRTENTDDIGEPEEVSLENPSFRQIEDQEAYILVYVHSGEGDSKYTLTCNKDFTSIHQEDVYDCNHVITLLIVYSVAACVVFGLSIYLVRHKKKKILKPKKKKKPEKEEEKDKVIDLDSQI